MMLVHTGKYKTPLLQNIRNVAATTILIIKISATDMLYLSVASQGSTVFATSWTNSKIQTVGILWYGIMGIPWLVATGSGIGGFQMKICSAQMNRICSLPQQY